MTNRMTGLHLVTFPYEMAVITITWWEIHNPYHMVGNPQSISHGEVRAAAHMEAGGASGRASRGPRSSARGEGEREEAKTNLATATATTGLSGGGGRRRAMRGHRRRNGDGEATASAACRAEQRRGCVSRTGAARGEGFWQTRGRARPVWVEARHVGRPGVDAGGKTTTP